MPKTHRNKYLKKFEYVVTVKIENGRVSVLTVKTSEN